MEVFADDAWSLLRSLGWSSFNLLGLSFGGLVAQELMLSHGDAVEKAVLVSVGAGYAGNDSLHATLDMPLDERFKTFLLSADTRRDEEWLDSEQGQMAMSLMRRNHQPGNDVGRRYQLEARAAFSSVRRLRPPEPTASSKLDEGKVGAEECRLLPGDEANAADAADGRLTALDTPGAQLGPRTLCLWAVHDGVGPIDAAVELHQLLPGSTLCLFESGHWPILAQEDPPAFIATVISFLEGRGVPPDVEGRSEELKAAWLPGGSLCPSSCNIL